MAKSSDSSGTDALTAALRLLTGRDLSTARLRHKLQSKGHADSDIDAAIERCQNLGYLDDLRLARNRVRSQLSQGKMTGRRLSVDLRQQGLTEQVASQAMEEATAEFDQEEVLAELVARRFPNFCYLQANAGERRRVVQFLQRRGFPFDQIMTTLTRKGSD